MSTLDWSQLIKDAGESSGGNYEPIPDGDYEFVVVEAPVKQTSSGKTMFALKAQVSGGAFDKRLVWDNMVVSPENSTALGIFFSQMAAMGLQKEGFFDRSPSVEQISQALSGRRFRGRVSTRTYNGKKSNEIKNYYPSQTGSVSAPGGVEASAPAPSPAPAPAAAPFAGSPAPAPSGAPSAPF